jgi:DNA-binding MarR family transcriptional regulator
LDKTKYNAYDLGVARDNSPVKKLLEWYPRIYFACHRRHVRDPRSGEMLSARQGSILDHLDERQPTTLRELARHMGVTDSTMSVQVDRLVRTGYVTRERDAEDPRRRNLRLSRAGVRLREANSVLDEDRIAEMLERLSLEELEVGMAGLGVLAKAAGEITAKEPLREALKSGPEERGEAATQEWEGPPERRQKRSDEKASERRRRDAGEPGRRRSAEEEAEVQDVVRELQRIQRELAEMMGGGKKAKRGGEEPRGGEAEIDEDEELLE